MTPVSSPSPQAMVPFQKQTSRTVNRTLEVTQFLSGIRTPFQQFIDFVHQESFIREAVFCFSPRRVEASTCTSTSHLGINAAISTEHAIGYQQLLRIPTFDGPIIGRLFNGNYYVHPVHFNPRPYLPPHINTVIQFDMRDRIAYPELLKHVVLVVSNNIDEELVDKIVIILANDAHLRTLFARLISHNLPSLKICIDRFWFPAVRYGNPDLVRILIDAGVDLNIRGGTDEVCLFENPGWISPPAITALQCAIENGNDKIINLLLKHNANDWHAKILHSSRRTEGGHINNYFKACTIIDLAVTMGKSELLKKLLDYELRILGCHQSASHYTLRIANMLIATI
jgi:hypothetical protein